MEMKDEIRLAANRAAVWDALNDPDVLKQCIPGCETLDKTSDTEFVAVVVAKVGPIKARFSGKVTLSDINAPVSYRLTGEGQGGVAGFAKADIVVDLVEEAPNLTLLRYGVTANIGGKIAALGSRLIDSTARKMADQFFVKFNAAVCGDEVAGAADAGSAAASSTEYASATPVSMDIEAVEGITVALIDVGEDADLEAAASAAPVSAADARQPGFFGRLFGAAPVVASSPAPAPAPARSAGKQPSKTYKAALVTINRPQQRNAVSLAMWNGLGKIFQQLGRDPKVRAILLTGAGGNFSAGADIVEFDKVRATPEQGEEYEIAVDRCCDAIASTPKPTIAVVEGFCMGGACHIAMSCDFRFAQTNAQFAIPAARLSIVYGMRATQRLLALVGVSTAKRILYSAKKFDAAEAYRIGFADRVSGKAMAAARSYAGVMADNAPLSIAGAKLILTELSMGKGQLTDARSDAVIARAVASDDYRNARQAFVEKRPPVFEGK